MMLSSARKPVAHTTYGETQLCVRACLTYHEAHEFVRQDAGADEGHPQADVKFPGALRLHPHKQAGQGKRTQASRKRALIKYNDTIFCPYFFIFSNTSAILPKRFWKERKKQAMSRWCFTSVWSVLQKLPRTCAFCATSRTSWNFSETVRSSLGGSWGEQGEKLQGCQVSSGKQKQEENRTMGSETSGTMLHWILQPLEHKELYS